MAKLTVRLYTALKEKAGTDRIDVDCETVARAITCLSEQLVAEARDGLFDQNGKVRSRFTLCLNSALLDPKKLDAVVVQEGDTLHIMPPIAGG